MHYVCESVLSEIPTELKSTALSMTGVSSTAGESFDVDQPRSLSIIVPLLNERAILPALISHLDQIGAEQIIFVDGGSEDGSVQWLRTYWEAPDRSRILVTSNQGRAKQMNAGAAHANSDLLLFLHADCRLPVRAKEEILEAREQQRLWGRFDVAFFAEAETDHRTFSNRMFDFWMMVIALFMNVRSRLTSIATGDHALFIDHLTFARTGGYAEQPLMEDVAISRVLKRYCVPYCSHLKVTTSARRWRSAGLARTVLTMWCLRIAYFLGVSPHRLEKIYRQLK